MLVTKMLVQFWLATDRLAFFRPDNGTFCAVLISCLPVMGRHRPLWLCSARHGFAFIGNLQRLLWARVRYGQILAVMASLACYGLCNPASYAVPVMG